MKHYWTDVPRLGNLAITRHAQSQAEARGISETMVADTLAHGEDTPDSPSTVFRDRGRIRLVIIPRPEPYRGAALCVSIIRLEPQQAAR
jgi:hypothetical protein